MFEWKDTDSTENNSSLGQERLGEGVRLTRLTWVCLTAWVGRYVGKLSKVRVELHWDVYHLPDVVEGVSNQVSAAL